MHEDPSADHANHHRQIATKPRPRTAAWLHDRYQPWLTIDSARLWNYYTTPCTTGRDKRHDTANADHSLIIHRCSLILDIPTCGASCGVALAWKVCTPWFVGSLQWLVFCELTRLQFVGCGLQGSQSLLLFLKRWIEWVCIDTIELATKWLRILSLGGIDKILILTILDPFIQIDNVIRCCSIVFNF